MISCQFLGFRPVIRILCQDSKVEISWHPSIISFFFSSSVYETLPHIYSPWRPHLEGVYLHVTWHSSLRRKACGTYRRIPAMDPHSRGETRNNVGRGLMLRNFASKQAWIKVNFQLIWKAKFLVSGEAGGEIWNWSLLGVKGLTRQTSTCYQGSDWYSRQCDQNGSTGE